METPISAPVNFKQLSNCSRFSAGIKDVYVFNHSSPPTQKKCAALQFLSRIFHPNGKNQGTNNYLTINLPATYQLPTSYLPATYQQPTSNPPTSHQPPKPKLPQRMVNNKPFTVLRSGDFRIGGCRLSNPILGSIDPLIHGSLDVSDTGMDQDLRPTAWI